MSNDKYIEGISIYLPSKFVLSHKVIPRKTFLKRKCNICKQRKKVAYMEVIVFMTGDSSTKYLCENCGENEINAVKKGEKIRHEQISNGHLYLGQDYKS